MNKEEAIKIVKSHYPANKQMLNEALEFLIPELKESEDELTWLTNYISEEVYSLSMDIRDNEDRIKLKKLQKSLAWLEKQGADRNKEYWKGYREGKQEILDKHDALEKQGEQKPIERKDFISIPFGAYDSELVNETITIPDGCVATIEGNKIHIKRKGKSALEAIKEEKVDNANKVEPKFHEGDYIVDINCGKVLRISEILTEGYSFENGGYSTFDNTNKRYRLWNIKDAKDGDVICYKDEISLYKHAIINCTKGITFGGFVYYCCYDGKRFITDSFYSLVEQDKMDIHLATKKQRHLLYQKMKKAGYEWDTDKKELKNLIKHL